VQRFAVIASDGVWDHLSDQLVVDTVATAIRRARPDVLGESVTDGNAGRPPPPLTNQRSNSALTATAAASACDAVLDRIESGQASGELGSGIDDRSIVVILLSRMPPPQKGGGSPSRPGSPARYSPSGGATMSAPI
jgi:serine/threonine protein phosphatase PrpC